MTIEQNTLESALQSAIDRHNDQHEYKVTLSDFKVIEATVYIKGVLPKKQANTMLEIWANKIGMHYSKHFTVRTQYLPHNRNLSKSFKYGTISK